MLKKTLFIFAVLFIFLFWIAFEFVTKHKNKEMAGVLKNKEIVLSTNLKVIYHTHEELAEFVYASQINRPKIIDIFKNAQYNPAQTRAQLLENLSSLYNDLKKIGLRQLHFHLPNGDSFLRFHRPNRFGDNLLKARESVAYVSKHHHPISGFEEGKIFSGFRFVYPLFSQKNYIGSVEVSYNVKVFTKELTKLFPLNYTFITKKDITDKKVFQSEKNKYTKSTISDDYYVEKNAINPEIEDIFKHHDFKDLDKKLRNKNSFVVTASKNDTVKTVTFLAIKNPITGKNVAFIVGAEDDPTLFEIQQEYYYILSTLFLLILGTFWFIYREIKHRVVLEEKKEETNKILLGINSILKNKIKEEVEKNLEQNRLYQEKQLANVKFTSIGKLAAGITHEINTPLTYIKANFEMMGYDIEDLPESELKIRMVRDKKSINDGISRLSNIVESMREMSQKSKEAKEKTNLYATLITALTMAHNRAKQISQIYLQGELFEIGMDKDKLHFDAYVQKQRIEQVWIVIINNALDELVKIDFFEKRRIDISLFCENDIQIIRIKDNAGGIDEKIMPNLYEPFESTKESSGMGVGLNIAKKIIQENEGEIRAYNEDDGAVFECRLDKVHQIVCCEV